MIQKAGQIPSREELQPFMDKFQEFCIAFINSVDPSSQQGKELLLLIATFVDDYAVVKSILDRNEKDYLLYGHMCSRASIATGNIALVKLLFERHPEWFTDTSLDQNNVMYPIEMAAIKNQREIVELLLPLSPRHVLCRPGSIDPIVGPLPPLLFYLIKSQQRDMLRLILSKNPDLELRAHDDHTALSIACFDNDYESARLLIEADANVNVCVNSIRGNAMSEIPQEKDPLFQLCKQLMTGGGGMNMRPLDLAASHGNLRLVNLLLKSGAKVEIESSTFGSALMIACRMEPLNEAAPPSARDYPNVVRLLLLNGANVNRVHPVTGETALHMACKNKNEDIATQLLVAGARKIVTDSFGVSTEPALNDMGLLPRNEKTAQMKLRMQREQENKARVALRATLLSFEKKAQPIAGTAGEIVALSTDIKKKKKKKKKKKAVANSVRILAQTIDNNKAPEQEVLETPAVTIPPPEPLPENPQPTLSPPAVTKMTTIPAASNKKIETEKSKPISQATILSRLTPSIFKPDIPTGDNVQKFPLCLDKIKVIIYYVCLVPNRLNEMFGSDRTNELKKVWAAIKSERLLPASSQNKACVKMLSLQERQKLSVGFFKQATHKVKPNCEDLRVYLEAKHATEEGKSEIHLDLIGPDFNAH